jgi:hypothetical protein
MCILLIVRRAHLSWTVVLVLMVHDVGYAVGATGMSTRAPPIKKSIKLSVVGVLISPAHFIPLPVGPYVCTPTCMKLCSCSL